MKTIPKPFSALIHTAHKSNKINGKNSSGARIANSRKQKKKKNVSYVKIVRTSIMIHPSQLLVKKIIYVTKMRDWTVKPLSILIQSVVCVCWENRVSSLDCITINWKFIHCHQILTYTNHFQPQNSSNSKYSALELGQDLCRFSHRKFHKMSSSSANVNILLAQSVWINLFWHLKCVTLWICWDLLFLLAECHLN